MDRQTDELEWMEEPMDGEMEGYKDESIVRGCWMDGMMNGRRIDGQRNGWMELCLCTVGAGPAGRMAADALSTATGRRTVESVQGGGAAAVTAIRNATQDTLTANAPAFPKKGTRLHKGIGSI